MFTKTCHGCQQEKPVSEYGVRRQSWDGLTPRCAPCRQVMAKAQYQRNMVAAKARAVASKRQARLRNGLYLLEYRQQHPCVDCGEADPDVLDLDHVRGEKDRSVYELGNAGVSLARLQAEIDKCESRCANCHRRVTRRRERESRVDLVEQALHRG